MSKLDNIKARVDTNRDNKMSLDELERARTDQNSRIIDTLKAKAGRYDGNVNIKGLENLIIKI